MPQDFSGQNLRGRSFKGQKLNGADFSHADIRGANFTEAELIGANFSHAKAGLQHRWAIVLVMVSLLLSALSGFASAYAGAVIGIALFSKNPWSVFSGQVILITLLVFFIVTIRRGLVVALVAVSVAALGAAAVAAVVAWVQVVTVSAEAVLGAMWAVAVAVAKAVGGAGAVVVAGAVIVAGAVAGSGSGAVAVALAGAIAGALAGVMVVVVAEAGSAAVKWAVAVAVILVGLSAYLSWRTLAGDEKYAFVRTLAIVFAATGGTSFRKADLTDANFSQATLKRTDFRGAILTRTYWYQAKKLNLARVGNSILLQASIRDLLVSGNGYKKSYIGANLKGANLTGANLEKANLKEADISQATLQKANLKEANLTKTQAIGTDFTNAYLTGACLEAWNIDSTTKLDRVDCQCVYLLEHEQPGSSQHGERRPSSGKFAPGEFTKLFEEVLNTVDLIFRDGIDWKAFVAAFKKVQVENEGTELAIQSIENKGGGVVVVRVSVPPDANKEKIHSDFTQNYELALKAVEEKYKAELKARDEQIECHRQKSSEMKEIIGLLASRPVINEVKVTAESKAMNESTDASRKIQIGDVGGDFKPIASPFSSDDVTIDISGTVAETINQLPTSPEPDKPGIKELLTQLQEAIEADTDLTLKNKEKALKQVKALAEAAQNSQEEEKQDLADTAITMLKGIISGLPGAAALVEACNKLLPAIASLLGLG